MHRDPLAIPLIYSTPINHITVSINQDPQSEAVQPKPGVGFVLFFFFEKEGKINFTFKVTSLMCFYYWIVISFNLGGSQQRALSGKSPPFWYEIRPLDGNVTLSCDVLC